MCYSDEEMWASIGKVEKPTPRRMFHGCGALIMELFCGALFLTALAASAGWPVSQPTDITIDSIDLRRRKDQKMIEEQIERDDPFCLVIPFPCGPWNSLSYFNMARFPHVEERVLQEQEEHRPMLSWVGRISKRRIEMGRVVLLENGQTSRALKLEELASLEGTPDGLVDTEFEWVVGDQCLMGQADRESGMPFRARTCWGTNADAVKTKLGKLCSGEHEHQQVMGSNAHGPRSVQKATWPEPMCKIILKTIIEEMEARSNIYALPAATIEEEREERGALDAPEDPLQVIGTELGEEAEREQELMDSLQLDGFPEKGQERRREWLKLPRTARAAIRRLHVKLNHKPKAVLLQILKGARADPEVIKGVAHFKCDHCLETSPPGGVAPVKAPSMYAFNHEVIVDVFYTRDMAGDTFGWLSIVCNGTTYHSICLVTEGRGTPKSGKCLAKFMSRWASWAGFPQVLTSDRGLHNRGDFARGLAANGVHQRQAGLEATEQIGRGERHGGIMKALMKSIMSARSR